MATLKHINSKNADYGAAEQYLLFEACLFIRFSSVQFSGRHPQLAMYSLSSYTLIWIGTPD